MIIPSSRAVSRFYQSVLFHWASGVKCEGSEADGLDKLSESGEVWAVWLWRNLPELLKGWKNVVKRCEGIVWANASCPECRFAFRHFFSPLEVPGFWNGTRNASPHSQNTFLQLICFRFLTHFPPIRLVNKIAKIFMKKLLTFLQICHIIISAVKDSTNWICAISSAG